MSSEKELQKQCIAYMKLKNIVYTHQGNEFISSAKSWQQAKNLGMREGMPDFIIFLPKGKTIFVELKSKNGKLRDSQVVLMNQVLDLGFKYHIVRDFETFVKVIENEI